jgi:hypothetical protein
MVTKADWVMYDKQILFWNDTAPTSFTLGTFTGTGDKAMNKTQLDKSRDIARTCIYAFLYGGGDTRIVCRVGNGFIVQRGNKEYGCLNHHDTLVARDENELAILIRKWGADAPEKK